MFCVEDLVLIETKHCCEQFRRLRSSVLAAMYICLVSAIMVAPLVNIIYVKCNLLNILHDTVTVDIIVPHRRPHIGRLGIL